MTTEQRLERLERQNRWMRRIGAVAVAVAAAVFLIGQGKEKPGVIEASKFVLVNADGAIRAVLESVNSNSGPAELTLFDNEGKRVALTAGTQGASGIYLFGKKGVRAGLAVGSDADEAELVIIDKDNTPRVQLGCWLTGSPALMFRDRDEKVRAWFYLERPPHNPKEDPAIKLLRKDGKVIWKAPGD
jgi:hypothetical protein